MLSLDFAFRVRQNYYHQNMAKLKNEKEYRAALKRINELVHYPIGKPSLRSHSPAQ